MSDEEPTLSNIAKEIAKPGYLERAQERGRASKTVWDLVFMPVGFAAIGLFWFGFFRSFVWLHVVLYPADAGRIASLLKGSMTLGQALIALPPMLSAVPLGLMTSNVLFWLVPLGKACI